MGCHRWNDFDISNHNPLRLRYCNNKLPKSIGIILFIRGIGGAAIKSAVQAGTFVGIAKKESAASSLGSKLFVNN